MPCFDLEPQLEAHKICYDRKVPTPKRYNCESVSSQNSSYREYEGKSRGADFPFRCRKVFYTLKNLACFPTISVT